MATISSRWANPKAAMMQHRIVNILAIRLEHLCPGHVSYKTSTPVTKMNFRWREGVYNECALYEELIHDNGKVLGCIMRFYEENCPTYAMTETKRLGPKKDDQAARWAVEEAISEEVHRADIDPYAEAIGY
jgi:hypothetical protein